METMAVNLSLWAWGIEVEILKFVPGSVYIEKGSLPASFKFGKWDCIFTDLASSAQTETAEIANRLIVVSTI